MLDDHLALSACAESAWESCSVGAWRHRLRGCRVAQREGVGQGSYRRRSHNEKAWTHSPTAAAGRGSFLNINGSQRRGAVRRGDLEMRPLFYKNAVCHLPLTDEAHSKFE